MQIRAVEQQYQELERCHIKNIDVLVHDQKHMLKLYIQECIENKDLNGIACITLLQINTREKAFRDEEKKFWTGIDVLDKTILLLNIKVRKMDALDINFELDASVDRYDSDEILLDLVITIKQFIWIMQ